MSLPSFDRQSFRKPHLKLAVAQVRYPPLFRFQNKEFLAPFLEAVVQDYPKTRNEHLVQFQFSPQKVEQTVEGAWRFTNVSDQWSIVLSEKALTVECRKEYSGVEDMGERLVNALEALKHLGVSERLRLGVRFVNEFSQKGATTLSAWSKLINADLVGAAAGLLDGEVEHSIQHLTLRRPNGVLIIRHGLITGSSLEPTPPAPGPEARCYLFDLDYAIEQIVPLDAASTRKTFQDFHDYIYQVFRWGLGSGPIYNAMEPNESW